MQMYRRNFSSCMSSLFYPNMHTKRFKKTDVNVQRTPFTLVCSRRLVSKQRRDSTGRAARKKARKK